MYTFCCLSTAVWISWRMENTLIYIKPIDCKNLWQRCRLMSAVCMIVTLEHNGLWRTGQQGHANAMRPFIWILRPLVTLDPCYTHTHTHTHLTALFPWLPGWAGTRKVKPIKPAPHHWVFYRPDALRGAQPTVTKHWRHCAVWYMLAVCV